MSCKDNHKSKKNHCVCDVVKFINDLQDNATMTCPTGCDVPFLGANPNVPLANTRPFLLFLPNGELFTVPAFLNNRDTQTLGEEGNNRRNCVETAVFRVESVDDDCCAVLRALVPVDRHHHKDRDFCDLVNADFFIASNSCVTVDLDCFCAIQCLRDVHVNNL